MEKMWWWSGAYNTFIINIVTIILLQTKANARDSEESRCRWSHSCSLYQREVSCVERGEVAGELRGSRGCTYPPASKALLQSSISHCDVQSEGETPPSGSQAKSHLAVWSSVIRAACEVHVMVQCARLPCVCALSAVSWRRLCNKLHSKKRNAHERYILC